MPSSRVLSQATFSVSVGVAMWECVGIVCQRLLHICPGSYVRTLGGSCKRGRRVVRRDMSMPTPLESLIEAVNVQLEAGQWANVAMLTVDLYAAAVVAGEMEFA